VVLLSQSQVLCQKLGLLRSVVCKACEVEVGKRPPREKVPSQHLTDWLYVETKSGDAILSAEEEGEEEGETQRKEESPTW
jgi:hypothetical protein